MRVGFAVNTHPDETFPGEVAYSLECDPIASVTVIDVNAEAAAQGRRYIDMNMGRAYPGSPDSPHYEERRAAEVVDFCRRESLDVILDMHTNPYDGNDYAAATKHDGNIITRSDILPVAGLLQFGRIVAADNKGIGWAFRNAIGIDISPDSPFRTIKHWRQELEWLGDPDLHLHDLRMPWLELYHHVETPTYAKRDELGLRARYGGFASLPRIRHASDLHAVTWGENFPPYSGEIVQKVLGLSSSGQPNCCPYHHSLP